MTIQTLDTIRNEGSFDLFWEKLELQIATLEVGDPELSRKRCRQWLKVGTAVGSHPATPKILFRQQYFEAITLIRNCVQSRFEQPGYNTYRNLQELLFKAIKGQDFEPELEYVSMFYGDDVCKANLKCQLQTFALDYPNQSTPPSIFDIKDYMKSLSPAKKQLIAEVCTVLKLRLVMPASNATSERTFSALRRVKTYLRSTTCQDRLNHLMILHVHKDRTDALDLKEVANEFVSGSEHRLRIFGKF